jgi:hypothetical protein
VSGGSGVVFNQDDVDDLDLLVAAEVVNRHDFVISRSRALNGEISPAERDDDDDDAISDDDATSVSSGAAEISNSESESEEDDVYGRLPRERLPAPQPLNQSFSIWDLLRKNMGKDLSRISMPANINQPLSLLQRTVEDFEYLDLLYRAIDCDCVETSEKTEQEYGTDTKKKKKRARTASRFSRCSRLRRTRRGTVARRNPSRALWARRLIGHRRMETSAWCASALFTTRRSRRSTRRARPRKARLSSCTARGWARASFTAATCR